MILFTILAIMIALLVVCTVLAIAAGGAAFIIVFADVIVCIGIIVWLIKILGKKHKKK